MGNRNLDVANSIFENTDIDALNVFLPSKLRSENWNNYENGQVCFIHDFFDVDLYTKITLNERNKKKYLKKL